MLKDFPLSQITLEIKVNIVTKADCGSCATAGVVICRAHDATLHVWKQRKRRDT